MASMSLPTPTLYTPRLRLRPFTDGDADALFDLHSSAHVLRYWDAPPWSERTRAERFIAACQQMENEGTGARLAIDRLSDGAFIGWSSLTRWHPDYRSASLGYCLHAAAWGQGYATEAARALLQWAFDTKTLGQRPMEASSRLVTQDRRKVGLEVSSIDGVTLSDGRFGRTRAQCRRYTRPRLLRLCLMTMPRSGRSGTRANSTAETILHVE
jgi:[ribosomal protein S5]-alanine N-acetyltransferase